MNDPASNAEMKPLTSNSSESDVDRKMDDPSTERHRQTKERTDLPLSESTSYSTTNTASADAPCEQRLAQSVEQTKAGDKIPILRPWTEADRERLEQSKAEMKRLLEASNREEERRNRALERHRDEVIRIRQSALPPNEQTRQIAALLKSKNSVD